MDKTIKYQSVEGGPFSSPGKNRISFQLPPTAVYNLNDSYVNINVEPEVVEDPSFTAGGVGVYPVSFAWVGSTQDAKFQNVAVVKNCSMRCAQKGNIENIRRVDILKNNLATLDKSQREIAAGEGYLAASQFADPIQGAVGSILTDINKEGIQKSRYNTTAPIQIKLSDLFDFCRTEEYDAEKAGLTEIHLECNLDKLRLAQTNSSATWDASYLEFAAIPPVAAAQDANTIQAVEEFDSPKEWPFFVGQKLLIDASGVGGLTFEQKWGDLAIGHGYSDITCATAPIASATPKFVAAELVTKIIGQPEGFDSIEYSTFSTEQDNGNDNTRFTRQYQVEPECTNALIMFPDATTDLFSDPSGFATASYRLRINQEDVRDRDTTFGSPADFDQLNMTLTNMGKGLKNLTQNPGATTQLVDYPNRYAETLLDQKIIATPMPQTTNEKLFQVNIESQTAEGVKAINIYKELPRVFEY
jgi:hypothetical protein